MFFLSESMHPQLKRRLTMAWLAATVGLNKLPKEDVIQLDIVKLCGDVTRFLQSNSSDPKKRFSLRLSSTLTHGTILLWNRQIKFCLDESVHFLINLQEQRKTNIEQIVIGGSKIPQPKTVPKRVRTKKILAENLTNYEINIPQEVVDQLFRNQEVCMTQRVRDLTLQEIEPFHRQNNPEDDYFGEPLPVSLESGHQVPEKRLSVRQLKETATEEPEQMPFAEAPGIPRIQIMSVSITEDQQANKENEAPALPPMQITTDIEKPASEPDRFALPRAPKKVQNIAKALYVKMGNPKFVPINRPIETGKDDVNYKELMKNWDAPLPKFAYFENFGGTPMEEPRIVDTLQVPQLSTSSPSYIRDTRSARGSKSELNEASSKDTLAEGTKSLLPVEIISSSLTPRIETSMIEHFPPAAANGRRSPVKKSQHMPALPRSILKAANQQKEIDQSINASIGHELELHEQVQIRSQESSEFGVKWADRIMAILENHPRLTHVEICNHLNEKLNKRNMATIFACLLALTKNGFVTLYSSPDSNKFEYAEKKL